MDYRKYSEELLDLQIDCSGALNQITANTLIRGEDSLLLWLCRQDAAVFPTDIMHHFRLSSGRVANILKKKKKKGLRSTQKKGLITRCQYGDDLRRNCIRITDEGRAYASACREKILESQTAVLEGLSEKEAGNLAETFRRILQNVDEETVA